MHMKEKCKSECLLQMFFMGAWPNFKSTGEPLSLKGFISFGQGLQIVEAGMMSLNLNCSTVVPGIKWTSDSDCASKAILTCKSSAF